MDEQDNGVETISAGFEMTQKNNAKKLEEYFLELLLSGIMKSKEDLPETIRMN